MKKIWGMNSAIHAGKGDDKIVTFFFVHGLHNRIEFLSYRGVDSMFPIGHEIILQACCVEHIGATRSHDSVVVL